MKKLFILSVGVLIMLTMSCGRTPSRFGGSTQKLELPEDCFMVFGGVDFDTGEASTVKNITCLNIHGQLIAQEFKDISPLEGKVEVTINGRSYCPGPDPRCAELENFLKSNPDVRAKSTYGK